MIKFIRYDKDGELSEVSFFSVVNAWLLTILIQILVLLIVSVGVFTTISVLPFSIHLTYIQVLLLNSTIMIMSRFIYYSGYSSSIVSAFPYFIVLIAYYLSIR